MRIESTPPESSPGYCGNGGDSPSHTILVIYNPVAGSRQWSRFQKILELLTTAGVALDIRETQKPGDATRFAAAARRSAYTTVAVAGGDGTVNEVVNGLHPEAPPLGIIPLGTANVLASELGIGTRPERVVTTLLRGRPKPIFCGRTNDRRFILMAGAGLDAEVVAHVSPAVKRRLGKLAYGLQTLRELGRYAFPPLTVEIDGTTHRAATAVICKARHYGGPHLLAPGAALGKPEFEVVLFSRAGILITVISGLALVTGILWRLPWVRHIKGVSVGIRAAVPVAVQSDGDHVGQLPTLVTIDPEPVAVLYPASD